MKKLSFLLAITAALPAFAQPVVNAARETAQMKLTIGQTDGALVIDRRPVTLTAGRQTVRLAGLPASLEATGEAIQARFNGAVPVAILEQKFRKEGTSKQILALYEGKTVTLEKGDGKQTSGVLSRLADGWMLQTADTLILNPSGTFVLPKLLDGPVVTPSLEWLVNAPAAGAFTAEMLYQIPTISWNARYRATLIKEAGGDHLAFQAWLDVNNASDLEVRNANVAFHQGSINSAGPEFPFSRPLNIDRKETRQLNYAAAEIPAVTEITADFSRGTYLTNVQTIAPSLSARLKNEAAAGLGLPLPAGKMTTWQQTADGALHKRGEQNLDFLNVSDEVSLALSEIKEISVTRTVVATRKLNPRLTEHNLSFQIENRGKQAVTVLVRDKILENSKITETTLEPEARSATTVRFKVEVPAGGKQNFEITVQVTT